MPLDENLEIARELLARCAAAHIILEVEIGVVGGEEDGVEGEIDDKLYSTPEDALATVAALGTGENGRYLTALTFGNVHGVYKPGNVKLRPEILQKAQEAVAKKLGLEPGARPFDLVFHGGSGSTAEEIGAAVDFGVVKMNVDTDTQYAFTRPVAAHMFTNYDGVLKVDGEVGNKKAYDPRAWGKAGEAGMAARVVEACENLRAAGRSVGAERPRCGRSGCRPLRSADPAWSATGTCGSCPLGGRADPARWRSASARLGGQAPRLGRGVVGRARTRRAAAARRTAPRPGRAAGSPPGSSIACAMASLNGPATAAGRLPPLPPPPVNDGRRCAARRESMSTAIAAEPRTAPT